MNVHRKEPVVWAYDDAPFTGGEVRDLLIENSRLRKALGAMMRIEYRKESDGRWIAEMAYGDSPESAREAVINLVLRILAERSENGE